MNRTMKKILNTIFLATFLFAAACSDGYDDTRIKKDLDDVGQILDELEQAVDGLRTQMDALTQLINSSFVSLISTDAEGNYVITYIDRGGESRTLTLATQKEVVTLPIVGIAKDEDGVWYWRQTSDNGETYEWILVDGEKVPAGGEKPEVGIDAEGFWTVNGRPITDAKGNKVLADDVSNILFKEAYVDEKTGEAVFILADGTELRLQMFEALSVSFDSPTYTAVPDYASKVKIRYTVGGSQAEGALVDIFTAYNVDAEIDESISTITVSLKEGAQEGNILVMAHAGGNTILKPLFFTYGTAEIQDPVYKRFDAKSENGQFSLILPKKPALMLKNILPKDDSELKISFNDKMACFVFGDYKMTSTLVEGRFPNYNSVIPQNNPKKIIIEKKELYNSLRRVSVMANQASNLVKFDVAEGKIVISAQDMDYSMSGHETLTCQYEGENIAIGFKSPFVLEILSNIESENVVLELSDPTRPGLFLPFENEDNDEDLLMLLMPMMV